MDKEQGHTAEELLKMLVEAIDYSFMAPDGTYNLELTYPVIDKVKYIKKYNEQWIRRRDAFATAVAEGRGGVAHGKNSHAEGYPCTAIVGADWPGDKRK